jgi:phosphogluconate dehydratase
VSPEAGAGGALAKVRDGDVIRLDAVQGTLDVLVDDALWQARSAVKMDAAQLDDNVHGLGRELFGGMRKNVTSAEEGACTWL